MWWYRKSEKVLSDYLVFSRSLIMWLDCVLIFILIFSIWSNLSAIWSVLECLVRLILDNKLSMTSVRVVNQQYFPSISAQRRADIPFSAALTFWLVPHEVHLRTVEPTACSIFFLQDYLACHEDIYFINKFEFLDINFLLSIWKKLWAFHFS